MHGYASPLCTPIHDYGCSCFLQLARDILEKISGLPTRKRRHKAGSSVYESFPLARKPPRHECVQKLRMPPEECTHAILICIKRSPTRLTGEPRNGKNESGASF
jgi:hypothetical protein